MQILILANGHAPLAPAANSVRWHLGAILMGLESPHAVLSAQDIGLSAAALPGNSLPSSSVAMTSSGFLVSCSELARRS